MKYKFQILCIVFALLTFQANAFQRYEVYTQTSFTNLMNTLSVHPDRSTMTYLYIDSYDGTYHSSDYVTDLSGMAFLQDCTALNSLSIQIGHTNFGQQGFDIIMDAIKDLKNLTYLYMFFYNPPSASGKLTNVNSLNAALEKKTKLTYLKLSFAYNYVSDFISGLQSLSNLINLTELRFYFYGNHQESMEGYREIFKPLTKMKKFTLNLDNNRITDVSPLEDAFLLWTEITSFEMALNDNNLESYTLQNMLVNSQKLVNAYIYVSRRQGSTSPQIQNFYLANSNVSYYNISLREGFLDKNNNSELFVHLPNLKTIRIYSGGKSYDYDDLKFIVDSIVQAPKFENLFMEFVSMPLDGKEFKYTDWYNLFDKIRTKIRYFYFYDHANYTPTGDHTHWTQILQGTTNLYKFYLRSYYRDRNTKTFGPISHPGIKEILVVFHKTNKNQWTFQNLGQFFNGDLPALTYPYLEFSYCILQDVDMTDFHYVYQYLAGRYFTDRFYINLDGNELTNTNFINNPYDTIRVQGDFYLNLNRNKLVNLNGFKNNLESFMHPLSDRFIFYMTYNQIEDVTELKTAISSYNLYVLYFDFRYNKIPSYEQFVGAFEGQTRMDVLLIYVHDNLITDQLPLNDVLFPLTYYGKSTVQTYYFTFIDPQSAITSGHGSLKAAGQYPAISENGVCFSNYSQAQYYYETFDEELNPIKNCSNCPNVNCHSCTKDTVAFGKCEKCRYSVPARVLNDDCNCPIGYYSSTNYTCPQCLRVCKSCDNGSNCLTCVVSNPVRINNMCICPEKYYDNGTNDQCADCVSNCLTCVNGSTCQVCENGYYKNGTNTCIKCPNKFATCSSATVGLSCQGTNRSTLQPQCLCNSTYYDNGTDANCVKCTNNCKTCNSASFCHDCLDGYYISTNTCPKCPEKFATCSNLTTGTQCKGANRTTSLPNCQCSSGFVDVDGTNQSDCVSCTQPCKSCVNQKTKCLSCLDTFYLDGNNCNKCLNKFARCDSPTNGLECKGSNRTTNLPNCECSLGFVDVNGTNLQDCVQCTSPCKSCTESKTKCLSCIDGYYLDGNNCLKCSEKFAKCDSSTNGLECKGSNRTTNLPNCECSLGFVDVNGTNLQDCVKCTSPCKSCTESKTKCQSCIDSYYLDGNSCVKCPLKFAKCSDPDTGIQCQGSNRSTSLPCLCNSQYYDDLTNADCPICENNCLTCNTATYCKTCHPGYYLDSNTCPQCPLKYETCSNISTGTKCQGNNRTTNLPNCECSLGFVDVNGTNLQDCVQCTSPCKSCIESKTKCLSCIDSYYLDSNSCVKCPLKFAKCSDPDTGIQCQGSNRSTSLPCLCNSQYYDDLTNQDCPICENNCLTCNTATYCKTCHPGFYLDSNTCPQCPLKYETCSNVSTGTKCQGNNRTTNLPNCECSLGFVDITGTNVSDCVQCTSPCKSCTESKTKCLSCIDGYYLDGKNCLKCSEKFAKCDSPTNGLECKGSNRTTNLPNCECQNEYFDDSVNANCVKCTYPCKNCDSPTNCLSCTSVEFRNQNSTCSCHEGYYDNHSSKTCKECIYKCDLCSSAFDICDICSDLDNRDQSNNCECIYTYFDIIDQELCEKCIHPCLTCTDFTECETCLYSSDINREDASLNCICKKGYYDGVDTVDSTKKSCLKCPPKCSACSDEFTCTECDSTSGTFRNNDLSTNCGCEYGYFEDSDGNLTCQICEYPCKHCTSIDICIQGQCATDQNRNQESNTCGCESNYYDNGQECKICGKQCKECEENSDNCIGGQCSDSTREDFPNCTCVTGLKEIGEVYCGLCPHQCQECLGSGPDSKCTSCIQGIGRFQINDSRPCQCRDGFYDDMQVDCQKCQASCKTCSDGISCDSCNGNTEQEILFDVKNLCKPFKTLEEKSQASFSVVDHVTNLVQNLDCEIKCKSCSDTSDNCNQCVVGINRKDNAPSCSCLQGYHDQNGTKINCLEKCDSRCRTCSNYNSCNTCNEDQFWYLDEKSQLCKCMEGYIQENSNNYQPICIPHMFTYMNKRLAECPPNTIPDYQNRICMDVQIEQSSSSVVYSSIILGICLVQIIVFLAFKHIFGKSLKKIINFGRIPSDNISDEEKTSQKSGSDEDKIFQRSISEDEKSSPQLQKDKQNEVQLDIPQSDFILEKNVQNLQSSTLQKLQDNSKSQMEFIIENVEKVENQDTQQQIPVKKEMKKKMKKRLQK